VPYGKNPGPYALARASTAAVYYSQLDSIFITGWQKSLVWKFTPQQGGCFLNPNENDTLQFSITNSSWQQIDVLLDIPTANFTSGNDTNVNDTSATNVTIPSFLIGRCGHSAVLLEEAGKILVLIVSSIATHTFNFDCVFTHLLAALWWTQWGRIFG
jgi:hypothetical protein